MATFTENNVSNATINGTTADDQFTFNGTGTSDSVTGFDGSDLIEVGTGPGQATYNDCTVVGGTGNDGIFGFGSDSLIYGNQGDDTILFEQPTTGTTVYGGQGNDLISSNFGFVNNEGTNFLIYGNLGNDTVNLTGSGGSTVYGGQGSDSITGSGGTDYINGGVGTDTITGGAGSSSTLIGGDGSDVISSAGAATMIYGNTGDDQLSSTGAQASIFGGQGSDTITLTGTAGANGGAATGAMNSLVYGNLGDDSITLTGANTSTVYGGQGSDVLTVTGSATSATDDGSTVGSTGVNNVLFGNAGDDVINTGFNRASVDGGSGNDIITGNNQNDVFTGGSGNDSFNITGATATASTSTTSAKALEITDFVSGTDNITLGGGAATSANFKVAQVNGGLDQAISQAANTTGYTFVAGSTNGYIFYNSAGTPATLTGATLDGLNSINAFSTKDIAG